MTSGTVAAFLTILGYSLYDTIIVFDRIRENMPRMPRAAFSQIVNRSMSEVLTRSLVTGLSTLLGVISLLIFGGVTLQDFAFAMLVGILSGTYSSIFIASPVLTAWKEREPGFARRRERIAAARRHGPGLRRRSRAGQARPTTPSSKAETDADERSRRARASQRPSAEATAGPDGAPRRSADGDTAAAEEASAERRAAQRRAPRTSPAAPQAREEPRIEPEGVR